MVSVLGWIVELSRRICLSVKIVFVVCVFLLLHLGRRRWKIERRRGVVGRGGLCCRQAGAERKAVSCLYVRCCLPIWIDSMLYCSWLGCVIGTEVLR